MKFLKEWGVIASAICIGIAVATGLLVFQLKQTPTAVTPDTQNTIEISSEIASINAEFTKPQDEVDFVSAKMKVEYDYDQAINDIQKKQIMDKWENDVCNIRSTQEFNGWIGTLTNISSNGGFVISVGGDVYIDGYVDDDSPVFSEISKLPEDKIVKVSGIFKSDTFHPDCGVNLVGAPWNDDAIKKPAFTVDLKSISPI